MSISKTKKIIAAKFDATFEEGDVTKYLVLKKIKTSFPTHEPVMPAKVNRRQLKKIFRRPRENGGPF